MQHPLDRVRELDRQLYDNSTPAQKTQLYFHHIPVNLILGGARLVLDFVTVPSARDAVAMK